MSVYMEGDGEFPGFEDTAKNHKAIIKAYGVWREWAEGREVQQNGMCPKYQP